jgi:hypothetical protein
LAFPHGQRDPVGLAQRVDRARLAAAHPQPPDQRERRAAHRSAAAERERGGRFDRGPVARREMHRGLGDVQVPGEHHELGTFGELDAGGEEAGGIVEAQLLDVAPDQVHVRPAGVLGLVRGQRDPQALLQCGHPARVAEPVERDAEVVQGVREGGR